MLPQQERGYDVETSATRETDESRSEEDMRSVPRSVPRSMPSIVRGRARSLCRVDLTVPHQPIYNRLTGSPY